MEIFCISFEGLTSLVDVGTQLELHTRGSSSGKQQGDLETLYLLLTKSRKVLANIESAGRDDQ